MLVSPTTTMSSPIFGVLCLGTVIAFVLVVDTYALNMVTDSSVHLFLSNRYV